MENLLLHPFEHLACVNCMHSFCHVTQNKRDVAWFSLMYISSLQNKQHAYRFKISDCLMFIHIYGIRGASKIKVKSMYKKRMATARRLIFLEFLKASIADLVTLLFSSLQNSEGSGNGDSGDSFADPCQLLPFLKTIYHF